MPQTLEVEHSATTPVADSRIAELDGLRGIAILLVLGTHLFAWPMMTRSWSGAAALAMKLTRPGWIGVDLFFVLSGFLITGILLNARSRSHYARNFYMRRALRILPLYLTVLFVLAVAYRGSRPAVLLGLAMSLNLAPILHITIPAGGRALWSLAVEEHFYLVWPWLVRMVRPVRLGAICVLICALEPVVRAVFRPFVADVYYYSWFRFDGLAWGGLIAVLAHCRQWKLLRNIPLPLIGLAALAAVAGLPLGIAHRGNRVGAALQFALLDMAFAGLLAALIMHRGTRATAIFRAPVLLLFGDLSYCLYITHEMVIGLIDHLSGVKSEAATFPYICVRAVIAMAICVGIAMLSRRNFEAPILRLKRHFH